jgi:hypothetical protein
MIVPVLCLLHIMHNQLVNHQGLRNLQYIHALLALIMLYEGFLLLWHHGQTPHIHFHASRNVDQGNHWRTGCDNTAALQHMLYKLCVQTRLTWTLWYSLAAEAHAVHSTCSSVRYTVQLLRGTSHRSSGRVAV